MVMSLILHCTTQVLVKRYVPPQMGRSATRTDRSVDEVHSPSISLTLLLRTLSTVYGVLIKRVCHVFESHKFCILMARILQPFHKVDRGIIPRIRVSAHQEDMVGKALCRG